MGTNISMDVLATRMESHDARIRSNHDNIAALRREQTQRGEAFVRLEEKVDNQTEDIAEMRNDMKWIKRGLFGSIAVGLMFVIAVASLVVQVAS